MVDRLSSVGAMVWIGLNHLKDGRGWQWSDGAPLSLVNLLTGMIIIISLWEDGVCKMGLHFFLHE